MSIIDEWLILCKAQVEGSGFNKLNKQIQTTKNSLFDAKNLFRAFIGYDVYSGIKQFATSLVQSTRDLGAMTSRFYAITKSEKLANEELQWTFDLAQRTAMGLKATADSYSIFYAATQKGLGTEGARQVFQDWTEVSRVLHLSEYQFERVTYALREMASKGAIYSQDLRMQIGTHVPNAMGLAEKAVNELGFTGTDWFDKFQKSAKGNQKLINQFIVLFSKYAKQTYASSEAMAKALEQPDAQIQRLYNTWQKFIYSLAGGQFQKDLVSFLKLANVLLEKLTRHSGLIYNILKGLLVLLGVLAVDRLAVGLLKVSTTIFSIVKGMKQVTSLASASVILLQRLGLGASFIPKLIGLLTTPAGLVILGVALVGAGIVLLDWFIKKFFPNVWIKIHLMLNNIGFFFEDLLAKISQHPLIQMLQKIFGGNATVKMIQEEKKSIRNEGGFWKNGGFDMSAFGKNSLLTAMQNWNNPLSMFTNPLVPGLKIASAGATVKHQIDINVNGNNVASEVGSDNLGNAIDKNQTSILGKIKRAIIKK